MLAVRRWGWKLAHPVTPPGPTRHRTSPVLRSAPVMRLCLSRFISDDVVDTAAAVARQRAESGPGGTIVLSATFSAALLNWPAGTNQRGWEIRTELSLTGSDATKAALAPGCCGHVLDEAKGVLFEVEVIDVTGKWVTLLYLCRGGLSEPPDMSVLPAYLRVPLSKGGEGTLDLAMSFSELLGAAMHHDRGLATKILRRLLCDSGMEQPEVPHRVLCSAPSSWLYVIGRLTVRACRVLGESCNPR